MVVIYMGYEGVEKLGEALKSSWGGGEGRGGGGGVKSQYVGPFLVEGS